MMLRRRLNEMMLLILLIVMAASVVVAQPPQPGEPPMTEEQHEQLRQRVESMRIWKLTELLQLEPEKAAVFFPLYRQYLIKQDTLNVQQMQLEFAIEKGLQGETADYTKLIRDSFELAEQQMELSQQFVKDAGEVLTVQQQAALVLFERRFHQRLREMMFEVGRDFGRPPGNRFHGGNPDSTGRGMGRGYGGGGR